jgi:hypothetical protein
MSTGQRKIIGQDRSPTGRTVAYTVTKPEGLVSEYPLSSVLVVVGFGLAVGVAIGSILGRPAAPGPSFVKRTELAAGNLGRHMLGAIAAVLPESLSKHTAS